VLAIGAVQDRRKGTAGRVELMHPTPVPQSAGSSPHAVLADPDLYARDPARFIVTTEALAVTRDELAVAEEQWLRLEMLREAIEGAIPRS
jgi:hypothetical protein